MKAIGLHHLGGSESLVYEETPKPIPKNNQVLVQVCATAITPTEFEWYPTSHTPEGGKRPFPIILGHEFSGVLDAVGSDCTDVQVGEHIYGLSDWFINGAQAEYCLTVPAHIAPKPITLEHTQAAVVPISALTAWQALIDRAHLSAGQRVLIHGAAGGVGSFAVQLARRQNAHVIATASPANIDFLEALGADEVINYQITPFEPPLGTWMWCLIRSEAI
ncbi:hypothetical protein W02_37920 [Nitrospira sp. KM1]|uniref:NADP-dependent oxidoreductase n=1 Tax=Nitrospira sp. KM1 TaxID=1936990 RepID=UPI0013A791A2|nr:NADP-dependent oxidoreductase [Nitrospira sp. KM1]BCA56652.1 hypothetical protein W02_37920 [Nitrospira sp. KM1]